MLAIGPGNMLYYFLSPREIVRDTQKQRVHIELNLNKMRTTLFLEN